MKKIFILSAVALLLGTTESKAQNPVIKPTSYGVVPANPAAFSPLRLEVAMKDKQALENIQLAGYIAEVCQKEGCWIRLKSSKTAKDEVMVKIKDHAFALPKDVAGKMATVNGTVVKKTQSVADQKHYLEDAGASKAEIAKITQPKEVYEMQALGVDVF